METALKQEMQKAIYEVTRLALSCGENVIDICRKQSYTQNINGICHKRAERGEYDAKAQKCRKVCQMPQIRNFILGQSLR